MADTAVVISEGSGTNIDTRTESSNGNHRQVVVIGDPATNTGVAPVDSTNGLAVDVKASVLPTGAATNAVLDTIDTVLDAIKVDTEAIETAVEAIQAAQLADGHNVTVDNASIAVTGTFWQATQPVSGTVDLGAVDNAVLDAIAASVDGIETLIGTTNTNTGNAATSLAVMDDWDNGASDGASVSGDVAHDGTDAGEPVKIGGRAQVSTASLEEVSADNDRVDAAFDRQGRLATWMGYPVTSAAINVSTSGDNTILAAQGAGKRIALMGCIIVSDGTTDVRWEDGASGTAKTGQIPLQAREGFVLPIGGHPWFVGTADTLLNLELTANVNVHGIASYVVMED